MYAYYICINILYICIHIYIYIYIYIYIEREREREGGREREREYKYVYVYIRAEYNSIFEIGKQHNHIFVIARNDMQFIVLKNLRQINQKALHI
jgi:hypothetical protein